METSIQSSPNKLKYVAIGIAAAAAAGFAWRAFSLRAKKYVIPGSKKTVLDHVGHYDMDGVSFDEDCGVVVGSDGRTPGSITLDCSINVAKGHEWENKPRAASQ